MGSNQYAQLLKKMVTGVISVTGGFVVSVGGWIMISAFSSGPDHQDYSLKPVGAISGQVKREPNAIASTLPLTKEFRVQRHLGIETISIGCLQDGLKIEKKSAANHVRVKAKLCDGAEVLVGSSSLINKANGSEATLFKVEGGAFTSDYISLSQGENALFFQIENSKGQRSQGLVKVVRE